MSNHFIVTNISSKNTQTYQFAKLSYSEKRTYSLGRKIGLLIGSFHPPHMGHFNMAEIVRKKAKLDYVWWIPSPQNPHKNIYRISINQRVSLINKLINSSSYKKFHSVVQLEQALNTNHTYKLLNYLTDSDKREFFLILGQDSFNKIDTWYNWQYIIKLVDILVYKRYVKTNNIENMQKKYSLAFKNSKAESICLRYSNYLSRNNNKNIKKWRIITGPLNKLSSSSLST